MPDAMFIARMYEVLGTDPIWLLTGLNQSQRANMPAQDAAEQVLLDNYRRCGASARANLIQTAVLLAAGVASSAAARPKSGSNIQVDHVVAGRDITIHSPSENGSGGNNVKGRTPARPRGKT